MKKIQHILLLGALLIGTFALTQSFSSQVSPVYAFTSCNTAARNAQGTVHGQAWSSNIGWVYLNCADFVGVPTPDFGVSEDVNGKWTGYGWSSNIGWLQFGGTGGPSGILPATGVSSVEIQRVFKDGFPDPVVGWARFLAGTPLNIIDSTCRQSPSTDSSNAGCWDGWVSFNTLNDQNGTLAGVQTGTGIVPPTNYGISIDDVSVPPVGNTTINRAVGGFTWGSTVVGWLHFSKDDVYVIDPVTRPPTIALTASPLMTTYPNYQTTLTYSILSTDSAKFDSAQTCTGTASTASGLPWVSTTLPGVGGAILSRPISSVNVPTSPTRFTITCPIIGGGTATNYVDVTRQPIQEITLDNDKAHICETGSVNQNQTTTFTWNNSVAGAQSCSLFQDGVAIYSGGLAGSKEVGPFSTNNVAGEQKVFTLKCFAGFNGTGAQVGNTSNIQTITVWPSTTNNGTITCNQPDEDELSLDFSVGGPICPSGTNNNIRTTLDWRLRGNTNPAYTYCRISRDGVFYPGNFGLAGSTTTREAGVYQIACYKADGTGEFLSDTRRVTENCDQPFSHNASTNFLCPEDSLYPSPTPRAWWDAATATGSANSCSFSHNSGPEISNEIELDRPGILIPEGGTYNLVCEYDSGGSQSATWVNTILTADDTRCTTRPPAVTRPIIKER